MSEIEIKMNIVEEQSHTVVNITMTKKQIKVINYKESIKDELKGVINKKIFEDVGGTKVSSVKKCRILRTFHLRFYSHNSQ